MQWMNPAAYTMPSTGQAQSFNWFDPNVWTQMMQPGYAPDSTSQGQSFFNPFDPSTYMPKTEDQPDSEQ
jgi:hypothetical protein